MSQVFDDTVCQLGEGVFWHPARDQLFWFDIPGKRLLAREAGGTRTWQFDEMVSSAGWLDETRLLVATQSALVAYDLETERQEIIVPLEADRPTNRSNDGRADPWGGFWIGTMGIAHETGVAAFYRYYRGELRRLIPGVSITNSICFDPEGVFVVYVDSPERLFRKQRLSEADGWPVGEPEPFIDLRGSDFAPDGSVFSADGRLWNAQWGAGRVMAYDRAGQPGEMVTFPARKTTCPAFGGPEMTSLFCTSAATDFTEEELREAPLQGMTFVAEGVTRGIAEPRVIL